MRNRVLFALLSALVLFTSCEYKELCYNHEEHALHWHINLIADYRQDWEDSSTISNKWAENWPSHYIPYNELRPALPSGLRVLTYNESGNEPLKSNIASEGGVITLSPGLNDIMLYNNDTEYIVFTDLENSATTRATTRTRSRSSYLGNQYSNTDDELTVNQPDMLYGAFIKEYNAEKVLEPEDFAITVQPLVYTYKVRFEVEEGLEYIDLARGALSGMAGSVYMHTGYTASDPVTVLFDCEVTDFGARSLVKSFGIPDFPVSDYIVDGDAGSRASDRKYALNLELKLVNDKFLSMDFDVTDQVAAQPHGGVIVVSGIVVKREEATTSGGFDVDVEGWGDAEDIVLPL